MVGCLSVCPPAFLPVGGRATCRAHLDSRHPDAPLLALKERGLLKCAAVQTACIFVQTLRSPSANRCYIIFKCISAAAAAAAVTWCCCEIPSPSARASTKPLSTWSGCGACSWLADWVALPRRTVIVTDLGPTHACTPISTPVAPRRLQMRLAGATLDVSTIMLQIREYQ